MVTVVTENGITFNRAGTALSWRLVYATGETTAVLFQGVGKTDTIYTIEEFSTEQEALDRMTTLGLTKKVPPPRS